jgi:hypothetical protein
MKNLQINALPNGHTTNKKSNLIFVLVNENKHKLSLLGFGGDDLQLSRAFLRFFKM